MASNAEVLLLALLLKKRKRRAKKRFHVHKIFKLRSQKSLYYTLFDELCADSSKFFNYFRMSKPTFDELLNCIKSDITGTDTRFQRAVTAQEKLVVTLRYLATGTSMSDLQYQYRLAQPTISRIVRAVCRAIWNNVKNVCFPEMTEQFWLKTATEFYERSNFPHCLGAMDGKHIRVIKPEKSGSLYYNYKHFFSVLLMGVCDANYKFIFIDVGACGKSSDSTVFKEGQFYKQMQANRLNIPEAQTSFTGLEEPTPFVFVADEGFGLSTKVLRPYAGKSISVKKRVFNYRLCRARRYIECTFGILVNKWRIFHRPLNVELSFSEELIKTCCVLHNFVRDRDGFKVEDTMAIEGLFDVDFAVDAPPKKATELRDRFAEYFISEHGAVPWQMERI